MHINNWPKPRKPVYNQDATITKGGEMQMQMLSMLGLSSDDITKLETALKAMAETPGKIDALIERINNLERSIKDGTGTAGTAETAGTGTTD